MSITNKSSNLNPADVLICRNINRKTGPNYYFASRFYPPEIRKAIWCLYAFVRTTDEIVDDPKVERPILKLGKWAEDWINAYNGKETHSPILRSTATIWHRYNIPYHYSEDFLAAMASDLDNNSYKTIDDVKEYMYGSASVIGIIISHIIGFRGGEDTLKGAKLLGDAMQMTNFIRDIREDIVTRNRVYLAEDDMKKFNVTRDDLEKLQMTEPIRALVKYYVELTHTWYEESVPYINYLSHSSRLPIRIAAELYEDILTKIAARDYDIFQQPKASLSKIEKMKLLKSIYYYNYKYDKL